MNVFKGDLHQVVSEIPDADKVKCKTRGGDYSASLSVSGGFPLGHPYYQTTSVDFVIPKGYRLLGFSQAVHNEPDIPSAGAPSHAYANPTEESPGRIELFAIVYRPGFSTITVYDVVAVRDMIVNELLDR